MPGPGDTRRRSSPVRTCPHHSNQPGPYSPDPSNGWRPPEAPEWLVNLLQMLGLTQIAVDPSARDVVVPEDEPLVFVITSYLPDMEPTFAAVKSAAQRLGMRAERAKDTTPDRRITDSMLRMIKTARFVVADLTHERPNVYFELGYARGIGKTVITIARRDTAVHVDVRDWSLLEYIDSRPLEQDLVKVFRDLLAAPLGETA